MGHARHCVRALASREALGPSAGRDPAADISCDRPALEDLLAELDPSILAGYRVPPPERKSGS
jgi:hypothetical protein